MSHGFELVAFNYLFIYLFNGLKKAQHMHKEQTNDRCKRQDTSHFSKLAPLAFHINAIYAYSFKAHTHQLYNYDEVVSQTNFVMYCYVV